MEKSTATAANTTVSALGSLGTPLAATLSYHMYHRFWLAVGHGLLSWYYVFYHMFTYGLPIIHRY
jgi:hypothetical protein